MKKNGNKGKRLLAGLLSFLMIASGTPPGELSVNASTLIPNTSLNDTDRYPYMSNSSSSTGVTYGSSESTGFTFQKMGTGLAGLLTNYDPADLYTQGASMFSPNIGNTNSFNIAAVIDDSVAARSGAQKGYDTSVRTAFGKDYWPTYYGFG